MRPADGRRASSGGKRGGPKSGAASGRPNRASAKKMIIASDYADAREVQRLILEEIDKAGFDHDTQFGIKLALEEAIINAIKHGNKLNKKKQVHVEWRVTPEMVEIVIEDEGPGFDRRSVPDPTHDGNLEKLTGRGILLIESYMSDVEWSKGGRRVRLVKKNPGTTRGAKSA
jgi:serine/threonine-protein kinase RsbW